MSAEGNIETSISGTASPEALHNDDKSSRQNYTEAHVADNGRGERAGVSNESCQQQEDQPALDNHEHKGDANTAIWPAGYYYQDSAGDTQGPCSLQDLQALHACFPEAATMTIWAGDGSGGGYSAQLYEVLAWTAPQQQQQLHAWTHTSSHVAAPLSEHQNGASAQHASSPQSLASSCKYAEAVLAGLPEDDEAKQLARLAAASGNSLESMLQFQHSALSRQAKEESAALEEDPYKDVRSWCSPEEWDAYLTDRQKRKDLGQPPCNWKTLKRRKQEIKAKQSAMSMDWLRK